MLPAPSASRVDRVALATLVAGFLGVSLVAGALTWRAVGAAPTPGPEPDCACTPGPDDCGCPYGSRCTCLPPRRD